MNKDKNYKKEYNKAFKKHENVYIHIKKKTLKYIWFLILFLGYLALNVFLLMFVFSNMGYPEVSDIVKSIVVIGLITSSCISVITVAGYCDRRIGE